MVFPLLFAHHVKLIISRHVDSTYSSVPCNLALTQLADQSKYQQKYTEHEQKQHSQDINIKKEKKIIIVTCHTQK